jgi:hypothetical protein
VSGTSREVSASSPQCLPTIPSRSVRAKPPAPLPGPCQASSYTARAAALNVRWNISMKSSASCPGSAEDSPSAARRPPRPGPVYPRSVTPVFARCLLGCRGTARQHPNTTDFRCFRLLGVLWCRCSVYVLESVSRWCAGMISARVPRRGARGSTVRGPLARGGSSFLAGRGDGERASRNRARTG